MINNSGIKLLALLVTAVVLLILWLPGDVVEAILRWVRDLLPWQPSPPSDAAGHVDKLIHFGLFALSAGLLAEAWRQTPALHLLLIMLALALLTEAGQVFIPGRGWDWWDVLADVVGAALAIFLVRRWRR